MSKPTPALDPTPLLQLGFAFSGSRVLLSAVELDLFSALCTPLTAEQLRAALALHSRAVPDFPDALVALGVLNRHGDGPEATYANTPETALFLVRSSPAYMGGMLEMCATRLYSFWGHFTEALKTGEIQSEANPRNGGGSMWEKVFATEEKLEAFMQAMKANNTAAHKAFAEKFDFGEATTLLDVGGALGQLCCEVMREHPEVKCVSLDFEKVSKLAIRNVEKEGMAGKVQVKGGDFWMDAFEETEVIVMGMVLHDYGLEKKKMLMRKAFEALPAGGRFVAIEMLIDDERRKNFSALLMSLNMMIGTEDGFDYSAKEFEGWATEVGFRRCEVLSLLDPMHAVVAYK